jgi:hypothetical protein
MINAHHIDRTVASYFGMSVARLHAKTKKEEVVLARMMAMLLCHELLGHNWNRLKKYYGKRSHATVRAAVLTARDMIDTNSLFRERYNTAKAECIALKPTLRTRQRRYNMHHSLKCKNIHVNAHNRTISIGIHQDHIIIENKNMRRLINENNYIIQYAII